MKVVILCGGLGTRMREETEFRPKPMVEIGGKPIIWHVMKHYAHYGFNDFVLCLGYKGEMIKEYFYNYEMLNNDFTVSFGTDAKTIDVHRRHEEVGWRVTLADTGESTLKGGRLKRIERYVDGDEFMVTYGDGVADVDIRELVDFHRAQGKLATVTGVRAHARFGKLKSEGNTVTSFAEKPEIDEDLVNGGYFVFNRAIFDRLTPEASCDLEYGPLEQVAAEGQMAVYKHPGFWSCMDTIRDTDYLNGLWDKDAAAWKVW